MISALLAGAADVATLVRQGAAELEGGRFEQAERLLGRALAEAPNSPEANLYLGITHFRMRRFAVAHTELDRAVKLAPSHAGAWKALGSVFAAQEDFRDAETPFRKACDLDPREEDACYYLGRNYYALNRFEPAIEAFDKALQSGRKLWRVHVGLALALEALGRVEQAEQNIRLAIASSHGQARPEEDPRIELGAFLVRQGRAADALAPLAEAVTALPMSARSHFELAKALSQLNRLEPAAANLEKALALEPSHWAAHLLLGKLYYRLGRPKDGERHTRIGQQGSLAEAQGSRTVR